jgi:5-formyltetrahydrofolate cyclo-ligase
VIAKPETITYHLPPITFNPLAKLEPMKPGDIREEIWTNLIKENAAAYPLPPYGHNPNFKGSSEAATLLLEELLKQGMIKPGDTVLSYPDYVLKQLRKGLLGAGINVVVPAKFGKGYRLVTASAENADEGSSISGAEKVGLAIKDLPELKMTFVACVAITNKGNYINKGYGFHLPESVRALPSATMVHPLQIVKKLESQVNVSLFATAQKVVSHQNSE